MGNARMLMSGSAGAMTVVSGEDTDNPGASVLLGAWQALRATELIAEAEQLVGNHVPLSEAARLIHPHPTFSEAFGERRCSKRTDARCTQDESPPRSPRQTLGSNAWNAPVLPRLRRRQCQRRFHRFFNIPQYAKLLASMPTATSSK